MNKLMKVERIVPPRLKAAILLYPYLHCWRMIKESLLGRKVDKFV